MTLEEAILHLDESLADDARDWCEECKNEHKQLLAWLEELLVLREDVANLRKKLASLEEENAKFRWYDLRKTPDCLPTKSGRYNVVFVDDEYLEGEYRTRYYDTELGWCVEGYDDHSELPGCPREYYLDEIDGEVIGWREIDDFHFWV